MPFQNFYKQPPTYDERHKRAKTAAPKKLVRWWPSFVIKQNDIVHQGHENDKINTAYYLTRLQEMNPVI